MPRVLALQLLVLGCTLTPAAGAAQERAPGDLELEPVELTAAGGVKITAERGHLWVEENRDDTGSATIELAGVFVLKFDAAGRCTSLREWWHVRQQ